MARPKLTAIIDFDDATAKVRTLRTLGTFRGQYKVTVTPTKPQRSGQQNRFYHAAIVEPFAEFLRDQDYEVTGHDEAHELLKGKFLTVDVCDPRTGEVVAQRVRSTTDLDSAEFSEYCERCRAWLLDFFHIVTEDPDPTHGLAPIGGARG